MQRRNNFVQLNTRELNFLDDAEYAPLEVDLFTTRKEVLSFLDGCSSSRFFNTNDERES